MFVHIDVPFQKISAVRPVHVAEKQRSHGELGRWTDELFFYFMATIFSRFSVHGVQMAKRGQKAAKDKNDEGASCRFTNKQDCY